MTEDFEQRVRAADPAPRDVDSSRSTRAQTLMEQIMSDTTAIVQPESGAPAQKKRVLLAAAAAVLVVAGIAGAVVNGSSDDGASTLALTGDAGGASMGSCIVLSADVLAPVDIAFDGTVTGVDGSTATLAVSNWYKGGDAQTVTVDNPNGGAVALIDGFEFVVGERYLVSATGGIVNSCGFSGAFSPELEALYAEAFAS